jgi:hypothetical protein
MRDHITFADAEISLWRAAASMSARDAFGPFASLRTGEGPRGV